MMILLVALPSSLLAALLPMAIILLVRRRYFVTVSALILLPLGVLTLRWMRPNGTCDAWPIMFDPALICAGVVNVTVLCAIAALIRWASGRR